MSDSQQYPLNIFKLNNLDNATIENNKFEGFKREYLICS